MSKIRKAGILLVNPSGKLLLVKQRESQMWGIPKGKMNSQDKDDLWNCARRELYEETGVDVTKINYKMRWSYRANNTKIWVVEIVYPRSLYINTAKSRGEIEAFRWNSLKYLIQNYVTRPKAYNATVKKLMVPGVLHQFVYNVPKTISSLTISDRNEKMQ
jgi:8-oxo-dGTP pyrophosphatase MutT (NUDIX family)